MGYGVVEAFDGRAAVWCPARGEALTPEEVCGALLAHLADFQVDREDEQFRAEKAVVVREISLLGGGGGGGGGGGSGAGSARASAGDEIQ